MTKEKVVPILKFSTQLKALSHTHITLNLLGSKELGTNVLELHFLMLANHDQNVFNLV